jgi:deoxyribonuclease IV
MLIGAHVSSSGGVKNSIIRASELGVEYLQTFLSAPQSYKITQPSPETISTFLKLKQLSKIKECYAHAIYLLNFASDKPDNIKLSIDNLINTLNISAQLEFSGVIIHLGSTKEDISIGIKKVAEGIKTVLENTNPTSTLLLENSAGAGNLIGSNYNDIIELINLNKGDSRLKVCIDTQHSFTSGYDIKERPLDVVDTLFNTFGKGRIGVVHLNDSKTPINSKRDRHENIGEGQIGYEGLKKFCNDKRFNSTPFILEVPGFEKKGPDKKNLEIVKSFYDNNS